MMRLSSLLQLHPRLAAPKELRARQARDQPVLPRQTKAVPNWATSELDADEQPGPRTQQQRLDALIVEAQARGDFDNLRGKGKPIPPEKLVGGDDAWLTGTVLTNSGFLPPWLQLQHEIDDDLAECVRRVERVERFPPLANRHLPLDDLRLRLQDVRAKTRRYNLMVPTMSLQRPMPAMDALLQRMERAVGLPGEGSAAHSD